MSNIADIKNSKWYLGTIDSEFSICMYRTVDPYKGQLAIYNSDGQELHRVDRYLAYGAPFGYDADDINTWFLYAAEWIDKTLYQIGE